jgi:cytochrome P450
MIVPMTVATRPPGPKGSWLGGNLGQFRRGRLEFYTSCVRTYGDFVSLRFGPYRIILVSDPDAIEQVLVTNARNFSKHFALRINPLILGNGLLTSEGDFWLRQRRLIQPAFQRSRLVSYCPAFVNLTRRMLERWQPGREVDILTEMERLTLDIAGQTLFGADVEDDARAVGAALRVAQDCFIARFGSLIRLPVGWPTPNNIRFRRAVRQLDTILYRIIDERRRSTTDRDDVLSLLLTAQEEDGSRMTPQQLRDEAMTLFLAGHETTALTLSWAWACLGQNPEAEARLAAEVHEVLGDRLPTADDLPRLRYTEWAVMETLRLYPPAYIVGREALGDCQVGGYPVPKGMTLLMCQWVMHRDPRFFDRPDEFRPERWAEGLTQRIPKYAYFPFGGGPRLCIGNTFATMEAVLVLATIAQKYRFTVVPGHPIVPAATFTLRPMHGVKALLSAR